MVELRVYDMEQYYLSSYVDGALTGRKKSLEFLDRIISTDSGKRFIDNMDVCCRKVSRNFDNENTICAIVKDDSLVNLDLRHILTIDINRLKSWETLYQGVCKAILDLSNMGEVIFFSSVVSDRLTSFYNRYNDKFQRYLKGPTSDFDSIDDVCFNTILKEEEKELVVDVIKSYFKNWYNSSKAIEVHDNETLSLGEISIDNWKRFYKRAYFVKGDCGICTIGDCIYYI